MCILDLCKAFPNRLVKRTVAALKPKEPDNPEIHKYIDSNRDVLIISYCTTGFTEVLNMQQSVSVEER